MALALGLFTASCNDEEDYSPATGVIISSVQTGSSDVTANSAVINGSVAGLGSQSNYSVGFFYGNSAEALTESVAGSLSDNAITATINGLKEGQTIYYQAYVTLQGKLTYKGEVQSFTTSDAKVTSKSATADVFSATLGGTVTGLPDNAICGITLSNKEDQESVRAGLPIAVAANADFTVDVKGLLPGKTYYYSAFVDLGAGKVYGDVQSFTTKNYTFDVDKDLVDLGLSTKWAKCNLGAASETELGGLYGFGDVTGLNWSTQAADYPADGDIYKSANDIVAMTYGKCTLPTQAQFEELYAKCEHKWVTKDGVAGMEFTGPNGNSIFLPAAGSRTGAKISGEGEQAAYMTGSISPSSSDFYLSYTLGEAYGAEAATPKFVGLSVRPVSSASNVAFDKSLLYKTWYLDIDAKGQCVVFDGPIYYYGTDDSWATRTNNEPVMGDSWNWCPDYVGNSWLGPAREYGSMTLNDDGTCVITRIDAEGKETKEEGTFTVDEVNKTISLSIDILGFSNFNSLTVDAKTNLKIFSISEDGVQIAILRDPALSGEGACSLVYNYITHGKKFGYLTKLSCYSNAEGDAPDAWNAAEMVIEPKAGQQYSLKYTTQAPRTRGSVFILDIVGLGNDYPNALVRIDEIKKDGQAIAFNAQRFFYGDIENNGNYRVEMANIWGKGHNDAWNGVANNAFTAEGGEAADNGPAELAFNETFEVTFTIVSLESNMAGKYDVNFITINKDWGGTWGTKFGEIEVKFADNAYSIEPTTISGKYEDATFADGSIMTFFEVANFPFMQPDMIFNSVKIDGTELSGYDKSKIVNTNEGTKYRYELWNCYGATSGAGCAFGTRDNDLMKELGFTSSIEVSFTMNALGCVK